MTPYGRFAHVESHDGSLTRNRRRQQRIVAAAADDVRPASHTAAAAAAAAAAVADVPVGLARREVPQTRADVARLAAASAATASTRRR